jgi:putative methyltransferase (TIGR04325 family)
VSDFRLGDRVVWDGCFSSFELAISSAKSFSSMEASVFQDKNWIEKHASATDTADPAFTGLVQRSTNLPIFSAAFDASYFVDFGGGSGWVYRSLFQSGRKVDSYTVIDIQEVVNFFDTYYDDGCVVFQTQSDFLELIPRPSVDVLYANSSMQYLPDNKDFLSVLESTHPRFVLLDELLWTREPSDWFAIQINSNLPVVARFLSLDLLDAQLDAVGYTRIFEAPYLTSAGFPGMTAQPMSKRIQYALTRAYRRR